MCPVNASEYGMLFMFIIDKGLNGAIATKLRDMKAFNFLSTLAVLMYFFLRCVRTLARVLCLHVTSAISQYFCFLFDGLYHKTMEIPPQ